MDRRGWIRAVGASLVALLAIAMGALGASAADQCIVAVTPAAGPAGTVFHFNGSGFTPARLVLSKDNEPAESHDIDVGTEGQWQLAVRSRPGDEGTWSAEFSSEACAATVEFLVTLGNTDAVDEATADSTRSGVPLFATIALASAGIGGGIVLGRRLQPAARDNRSL